MECETSSQVVGYIFDSTGNYAGISVFKWEFSRNDNAVGTERSCFYQWYYVEHMHDDSIYCLHD